MALFKKEDKKEKKTSDTNTKDDMANKAEKYKEAQVSEPKNVRYNDIVLTPRITEKSVKLMDKGIYTFNILKDANKTEVAKAIKEIFGVEPLKVRIINYPAKIKRNYRTGNIGKKSGGKKALVYLKEGDKISII